MPAGKPSLIDRIRTQLGMGATDDENAGQDSQSTNPNALTVTNNDDDAVSPGLMERIRARLRAVFPAAQRQQSALPKGPPDLPTINMMIRNAGRTHTLLLLRYGTTGNQYRLVAPYSFRRTRAGRLDLFGWCYLHSSIHRFRLDRITGLMPTDEQFAPMWPIEIG